MNKGFLKGIIWVSIGIAGILLLSYLMVGLDRVWFEYALSLTVSLGLFLSWLTIVVGGKAIQNSRMKPIETEPLRPIEVGKGDEGKPSS